MFSETLALRAKFKSSVRNLVLENTSGDKSQSPPSLLRSHLLPLNDQATQEVCNLTSHATAYNLVVPPAPWLRMLFIPLLLIRHTTSPPLSNFNPLILYNLLNASFLRTGVVSP